VYLGGVDRHDQLNWLSIAKNIFPSMKQNKENCRKIWKGETVLGRPKHESKDNIKNGTWRIGVRWCKLGSTSLRWPMAGSCEYDNKHSSCTKCDKYLVSQVANKDSPRWKHLVGSLRIFEVLTEARVFRGVVPCSLVNMYQHFSRPCCLHLQFRRVYPEASGLPDYTSSHPTRPQS
jgi:hypothetical protein